MTTQHTPGRPLEAFRRRLEACWHACEGYSTEELEHIAATPQRMRASLTAQRDELLAALKEAEMALETIKKMADVKDPEMVDFMMIRGHASHHMNVARAAIEKAERKA